MKRISILILLVLIGAVFWGTRLCTHTIDGKIKESIIIFTVIGILHCWAIIPLKIKGINFLFFFLYILAVLAGFYGSILDEMGGMLYFIIPCYIVLIFVMSQGIQWWTHSKKGKNNK